MHATTHLLAKEELVNIHFIKDEVLSDEEAIRQRRQDLHRAMILGNAYRYKVKINFETDHGMNSVETTVWHTTDTDVALKGGTTIPVRCIRSVIF